MLELVLFSIVMGRDFAKVKILKIDPVTLLRTRCTELNFRSFQRMRIKLGLNKTHSIQTILPGISLQAFPPHDTCIHFLLFCPNEMANILYGVIFFVYCQKLMVEFRWKLVWSTTTLMLEIHYPLKSSFLCISCDIK